MKRFLIWTIAILAVLLIALGFAGNYMLNYSLTPDPGRKDLDSMKVVLYERFPNIQPWVDSLETNAILKDTFVVMPSGEKHHAYYLPAPEASPKTAIVIHGYKDSAIKFFFFMRMYNRDLGYNVLMPDLSAHGLSEGEEIQMGWKDADDVLHWTTIADELFALPEEPSQMVIHGVSMGAATTMNIAGKEELPDYIKAFIEDCGYTSVWDEFAGELKVQFSLPSFPLMNVTSLLCDIKYGWNFREASPLESVAKALHPMLFIHGDADTFVPFWMLEPLYEAKPEPKEQWIVPGTVHAKAYDDYPEEYTQRVKEFLNKYM